MITKRANGELSVVQHTPTNVEGAVTDIEHYPSQNVNNCLLIAVNNSVYVYKLEQAFFD